MALPHGLARPAASETEIPRDAGQPRPHQTPSTRSEIHCRALPRIRWPWRTRFRASQAWASRRVKSRSSRLGVGSPLGWVWKATMQAAPQERRAHDLAGLGGEPALPTRPRSAFVGWRRLLGSFRRALLQLRLGQPRGVE